MEGYGSGNDLKWYYNYGYDDKINPSALTGLHDGDDEYFHPITLSKNNIVGVEAYDGGDVDVTVSFTYNEHGLPQTRKLSDGTEFTYEYDCQ